MKKLVYPMILSEDKVEGVYIAQFPDLDIITDGETIEDAFLRAKEYLQTFVDLSVKYDNEIETASEYKVVAAKNAKKIVLLSDATVKSAAPLTAKEKSYMDFVKKYFTTED